MRTLFHGSTHIVENPLCHIGRNNLDFGKGFYLTDLRAQATSWATRVVNLGLPQWLNVYELDDDYMQKNARSKKFEAYDKEWLDFIVDCRNGKEQWKSYDYIEGGIADDRVITTIEDYLNGDLTMELTLKRLSEHQPNNQICLVTQSLLDKCLHFLKAEPLNELAKKLNTPC